MTDATGPASPAATAAVAVQAPSATAPAPAEDTPRPRRRRWASRLGIALVTVLTLIGMVSTWGFFAGAPGVGHFRSADGRATYVAAYSELLDDLPTPSEVHDVVTDWGTVRVYEWVPRATDAGTEDDATTTAAEAARPVVLVPGRASGVPMWADNLPALATERRVLAFDTLGDAGLSVQSVPLASFADQAGWIDQVLGDLAPDGVHLVGHSFGGATAATYARQHPGSVRSLTLLEPVFTFSLPSARLLAWTMVSSLPALPEGLRQTALTRVGGERYDPDDPMARMIAAGSEHFAAALPQPAVLTDDQLAALTMPVSVAIAGRDSLAGGGAAAEAASALPDVQVTVWPDTTHSLPMQAADELNPAMLDFFAAND